MSDGAAGTTERMTITRTLDAVRETVWRAWTQPELVMQWWGPQGFTTPVCTVDLRAGGRFVYCMKAPDGQEFGGAGDYREIVPHERIVFAMYMADADGNRVEPAHYGVEHEAIAGADDVVTFEDLGDGRTRVTYTGNEAMEDARASGQLEAMYQSFDKFAAVVAAMR